METIERWWNCRNGDYKDMGYGLSGTWGSKGRRETTVMEMDYYLIKVHGHISGKRLGVLECADVRQLEDGSTRILYQGCDQAGLHSILDRIRNLGLVLIEVKKRKGCGSKKRRKGGQENESD